ncbi:hypothetical protein [Leifsonia aquatica]|uniref:hypothetical protein n=1 Tax=Leifsonia aquatica TaxID=144185 RepID=UPI0037F87C07
MNFNELVDKVAALPGVDHATVPYLVTRALDGVPTTSGLTLVAHPDGTYTATYGDLRTRIIPATDPHGRELRFSDEDSACEWAWTYIQDARGGEPNYDAEQRARDEAAGAEIQRRWDEFVRSQARSERSGDV